MTAIRTIPGTLPDFRDLIVKELDRRGWSHYQLVQALKGRRPGGKDVPAATVYDFLRGTSTINSEYLGYIFDVLGLEIRPPKK